MSKKTESSIEWFQNKLNKYALANWEVKLKIYEEAKRKYNTEILKAEEIKIKTITESIRLGAGSLGEWSPQLEKSILEEFQKLSEERKLISLKQPEVIFHHFDSEGKITELKDLKSINWIEDKYGRKITNKK
jgi:hypothetical protein